jgi:integrase
LRLRRALGRAYHGEEAILLHWDAFLQRRYGKACQVKSPMFQLWIPTLMALTTMVRRQRMRVVRNFLLFHARRHPKTYIPDPKTFPRPNPRRQPRLVLASEMARLLATAKVLPRSHRNPLRAQSIRLALILLFCCGLRRGELLRLKIRHFDSGEKVLRIEATKFHKSRLVPLPNPVAEEIQRYVALRRGTLQPDAPLLSNGQRSGRETTYSANGLVDNWQLLCLTAGVLDERGRPPRLHDLRHSFAVAALDRWYRQGVDVQSKLAHLATYMGHVSVVSTHYYLQLSSELGQSASKRFHRYASEIFTGGSIP